MQPYCSCARKVFSIHACRDGSYDSSRGDLNEVRKIVDDCRAGFLILIIFESVPELVESVLRYWCHALVLC
jgi:hypothetical protein